VQILTTLIKKKYGVLYILTMPVYNKMSQKNDNRKSRKKVPRAFVRIKRFIRCSSIAV